ncbi:acyl-CoA carboxylase subunit beta [Corynebacterium guangdongense]|uniref:Propionyl-CoA carboxylase beta chain n=1 Tax=Corynebacterium guangdongense TaxID=1783348 RepID=A0ABU1ZXN8_9CORY|nr:carboxyl transferase domain-containing protein [Corynebacterium guangdongense]MDR7328668.1 propionyl-CoA carboxylase beta chain [Corynebacterium guangdongense]WJZ17245.1 putative propionyl-CoA carboxylase beta chain 5 [Corynebacterium guangdongense]
MTQAKPDLKTTVGKLQDLRNRLTEAAQPMGAEAIEATHAAGRLTARETLLALLDEGSFVETDALARHRATDFKMERTRPATDGVVTGYGTVEGRRVVAYAIDETVFEAALGEVYAEKILKLYDLAAKSGVPIVAFLAGTGPRLKEGVVTLSMFAKIVNAAADASGLVPQISVINGETSGLHAVLANLADLVIASDARAHLVAEPADFPVVTRAVLGHLPLNNMAEAPRTETPEKPAGIDLNTIIPDEGDYDVRALLGELVDGGLLEVRAQAGAGVITGFARIGGRAVGVVATDPAAQLDAESATKAARFIRTADSFNLPILQVVDTDGFPAGDEESLRAAAQLAYANAEASVGKLTLITRRAYGSGYVLFGAKDTGADLVWAWPTAEVAVDSAENVAAALGTDAEKYAAEHLNPYRAAERGLVDAVIEPADTRTFIIDGLGLTERKVVARRPRKHGNIAL